MNHGTATAYKNHGCRCEPCTRAGVRYSKTWRVATRTVRGPVVVPMRVPIEPIVQHLRDLLDSGWGYRELAREAGVTTSQLSRMLRGRQASTHRNVAARLLGLDPLEPVALDPVVVDRLVAGGDWRAIGATRAERIAAAERSWAMWGPIRAAEKAAGTSDQFLPGESLTALERRLGLRAGRDFGRVAA